MYGVTLMRYSMAKVPISPAFLLCGAKGVCRGRDVGLAVVVMEGRYGDATLRKVCCLTMIFKLFSEQCAVDPSRWLPAAQSGVLADGQLTVLAVGPLAVVGEVTAGAELHGAVWRRGACVAGRFRRLPERIQYGPAHSMAAKYPPTRTRPFPSARWNSSTFIPHRRAMTSSGPPIR